VIEEQIFERVGGSKTIKTDVRIVTACNKDLLDEVHAGKFREDLYYRVAVFPIKIPPLRERKNDISELVDYFVEKYSKLSGREIEKIDSRTLDKLENYNWPGNIRQLQNSIRRAILLANNKTLLPEHFDFPELNVNGLRMIESLEDGLSKLEASLKRGEVIPLIEAEEVLIRQALNITRSNISKAAEKLGISRSTIYRKIQEHRIQVDAPLASPND
jgi:DNA-binding NtrC family response regulator